MVGPSGGRKMESSSLRRDDETRVVSSQRCVMRLDSIPFRPVRLVLTRLGRNSYGLARNGDHLGGIKYEDGKWWALKAASAYPYQDNHVFQSFRAAALFLARIWVYSPRAGPGSRHPQDYGAVRMIRINTGPNWYTVIFQDKPPKRLVYVYDDQWLNPQKGISDFQQAHLRRVAAIADRFASENLEPTLLDEARASTASHSHSRQ